MINAHAHEHEHEHEHVCVGTYAAGTFMDIALTQRHAMQNARA